MSESRGLRTALKVALGPALRPSPEEIALRRAQEVEARRLREEIGPIDISPVELIRQLRDGEADGEE